jgi:hypothetical protein
MVFQVDFVIEANASDGKVREVVPAFSRRQVTEGEVCPLVGVQDNRDHWMLRRVSDASVRAENDVSMVI